MTHAYDSIYLEDATDNFAVMLDFGCKLYNGDIQAFYSRALSTNILAEFSNGNPKYIAGMSGIELALKIVEQSQLEAIHCESYEIREDNSAEYWTGWALARLQWEIGLSFNTIEHYMPITHILNMYVTMHEADISKFIGIAINIIQSGISSDENPLKRLRLTCGLTQKELAQTSGTTLRMIQAYEQGYQDISKAEVRTILNLARALHCSPETLVNTNIAIV